MISILTVFVTIIFLFFFLLAVRGLLKRKFCVICASISLAWLIYFILFKLDYFNDVVLVSLLMGQSIIGVYYLMEGKVRENLHIFRLPFLLTLTLITYAFIGSSSNVFSVVLLLAVLWLIFIAIYVLRNYSGFSQIAKKIIECCKNW